MNRLRILFFIIFGLFHVLLLYFSFYATYLYQSNNIRNLLSLSRAIPYARWAALLGFILFFINLVMFVWIINKKTRRVNFLERERSDYKAKMFDLDHNPDQSEEAQSN